MTPASGAEGWFRLASDKKAAGGREDTLKAQIYLVFKPHMRPKRENGRTLSLPLPPPPLSLFINLPRARSFSLAQLRLHAPEPCTVGTEA